MECVGDSDSDEDLCGWRCLASTEPRCYTNDLEPEELDKIWSLLQEQLERKLIRKSYSEWEFPAGVVFKKNGKVQLCTDYRLLNAKLRKQSKLQPPSPEMAEAARRSLQGAEYFSYFDLAFWYKQVPISEEDVEKTAFMTPFGLYEHLRIPFGLAYAQLTLRSFVDGLFGHLQFKIAIVICDDLLLYSNSQEEHFQDVELVLESVKKENLTIRPNSMHVCCTFARYFQSLEERMSRKIACKEKRASKK